MHCCGWSCDDNFDVSCKQHTIGSGTAPSPQRLESGLVRSQIGLDKQELGLCHPQVSRAFGLKPSHQYDGTCVTSSTKISLRISFVVLKLVF